MLTLLHYDAQVVCLQEVTPRMFQQDLAPLLAEGGGFAGRGYVGVHSAMEGSDCRSTRSFFFFFGRGSDEADTYVRVPVCLQRAAY
jgi:mRNA deadenylase 3'-5' endonuclease subunit Ccr4